MQKCGFTLLRAIASVIAKNKKCKNLHNITQKTPTSVFLSLCKYTKMLQCKLCIQYFINFSLSLSLFFVCVHPSLLQIHPTLPNHHSITTTTTHHNSSQPMIFQSQNQPKTKENETKNQSKPKIKPSMENSTT